MNSVLMAFFLCNKEFFLVGDFLVDDLFLSHRFDAFNCDVVVDFLLLSLVDQISLHVCNLQLQRDVFVLDLVDFVLQFVERILRDSSLFVSLVCVEQWTFPQLGS